MPYRLRNQACIPAEAVTADKNALTLMKGIAYTLSADVAPADATDALLWISHDPDILRVDDGVIRPLKAGETALLRLRPEDVPAAIAVRLRYGLRAGCAKLSGFARRVRSKLRRMLR